LIAQAAREGSSHLAVAMDDTAQRTADLLRSASELRRSGAILIYLAVAVSIEADGRMYVVTTDADPAALANTALPLAMLPQVLDRLSGRPLVVAVDCVVVGALTSARAEFDRLFGSLHPQAYALVAPADPAAATRETTPLATFLARAVREGAFSPERDPESAVAAVDALWRSQQVPSPLWRWTGASPRETLAASTDDTVRAAQPPPTPAPSSEASGRPLIELGGSGKIWYATNRRPVDPGNAQLGYSAERDQGIHYGRCTVYVPESHQIGSTGSHWWTRLRRMTDDRLKLTAIEPLASEAYWTNLREVLDDLSSDARDLLVFLHGYNVTFDEAALRAAQIGCDLQFPGVTSFFSWPSKGSAQPFAYAADVASMEASEGAIADFLCSCAEQSGANRVHVIAHSMGNRGLLRALTDIVTRASRMSGARFGHFILAAPDVERDNFIRLAAAYRQVAQRTTLYVSDKDRALKASGILHDGPRAGFTPPVTVVTDIDTVEVSNVDLTALGHGYVAAARDVLRDMHSLLVFDAPPSRRAFLKRRVANDGAAYWRISG
jgi:esterase/lipase superfamily enzyme